MLGFYLHNFNLKNNNRRRLGQPLKKAILKENTKDKSKNIVCYNNEQTHKKDIITPKKKKKNNLLKPIVDKNFYEKLKGANNNIIGKISYNYNNNYNNYNNYIYGENEF